MEDDEYNKLLKDCSGLYIVKLLDKEEWYCFEKDELREIYDSLKIPGTNEDVEHHIKCMSNDDNCFKANSYKANSYKDTSTHRDEDTKSIHHDEKGYKYCEDVTFCGKNDKCIISGIIMCLGIAVVNENGDKLLCHYVTGNDHYETEKNKLEEIKQEMQERNWNWNNSKLFIYYINDKKHSDAQNKSINIVAEALNIDREKISLQVSENSKIYFEPNTKILRKPLGEK